MEKLETQESRELIDFLGSSIGSIAVPVPQIAVVGSASAGKSSVLSALSGFEFPSADVPCTRCPIQLRLCRRECDFVCRISLEYPPGPDDEVRHTSYHELL
jgi:hypothetical protein